MGMGYSNSDLIKPVSLDRDKLLREASKNTGLDDYGEEDFRAPLDLLLRCTGSPVAGVRDLAIPATIVVIIAMRTVVIFTRATTGDLQLHLCPAGLTATQSADLAAKEVHLAVDVLPGHDDVFAGWNV